MNREILKVEKREERGKGFARRMRQEKKVPGVLYGKDVGTHAITMESKILKGLLSRIGEDNILIDVQIGNDSYTSLLKEVQRDPVSGEPIHIDFHRVSLEEEITVSVAVVVKGADDSPGVMEGGVVETLLNEIEVKCLPLNIPQKFEVDISELEIGGTIHVNELSVPEGVELIAAPERTIVTVSRPSEVEVEEGEAAEPEVIGEEGGAEVGEAKGEAAADKKAEEKPAGDEAEKKEEEK